MASPRQAVLILFLYDETYRNKMRAKINSLISIPMKCSECRKTLQLHSERQVMRSNPKLLSCLTKCSKGVRREPAGCNESESTSSLVIVKVEKGDPLFYGGSQHHQTKSKGKRLMTSSGYQERHAGKEIRGNLGDPTRPSLKKRGRSSAYKVAPKWQMSWEGVGRAHSSDNSKDNITLFSEGARL